MSLNYNVIIKIFGVIFIIIGAAMAVPLVCAIIFGEYGTAKGFGACMVPLIILGSIITFAYRDSKFSPKVREGYLIVALCWFVASIIGAFPYFLSGNSISIVDAIFESVAGFTTTGCTVLADGVYNHSLFLWKCISSWLGGMGILIFVISVLPALGIGGHQIAKAEAPGPSMDKFTTKISDSAKILYLMYICFTILEFLLLLPTGMDMYSAFAHTLSNVSTGGFTSPFGDVASYDSIYLEIITSIFSFLASLNFVLYYFLIQGRLRVVVSNVEFKGFLIILTIGIVLMSAGLYIGGAYSTIGESLRYGFFHTISVSSTSGYSLDDYGSWPSFCTALIVLLMIIGGCSASTAGSLKVIRVLVLFKLIFRGFYRRLHPRAVVAVKFGKHSVAAHTVSSISVFIMVYMLILLFASLVLSLQNLDMTTTITATLAAMSNTGIGLGELGAAGNFILFSEPLRLFVCILMIMGRLEFFTIILMFTTTFWNPHKGV